jgi:hypothetical protein
MSERMVETEAKSEGYEIPEYRRFVRDMTRAGIEVEHYRGRFYYEGPAVRVGGSNEYSRSDVEAATKVRLQHDQMGLGEILYPR